MPVNTGDVNELGRVVNDQPVDARTRALWMGIRAGLQACIVAIERYLGMRT